MADVPPYYRALADTAPPRRPTPANRPAGPPPPQVYQAAAFRLNVGAEWRDKTVYLLAGPVLDEVQHNITVTLAPDLPEMTLVDFVDAQVQGLEAQLQGCRVLLRDRVTLDSGLPAGRVIYAWDPAEGVHLYQQQLYVLAGQTGYVLSTTFTRKTRKLLGLQVDRMMRTFQPIR